MNPPYSRNLHLKILEKAITKLKDENSVCVNLSPIRWLQDPLAKYKKGSDLKRFEKSVAKHIEQLNAIKSSEAQALFGVYFWNNLGVYVCKINKFYFYKDYAKTLAPEMWTFVEKIGLPLFNKTLGICRVYDMYSKNKHLPYWIKCSRVHGHPGQKDEFDCITPKYELVFNVKGNEGREVYFKSKNEANNFFKTMNLMFYKFLKKLGCWPTTDFNKGLPFLGDTINPRTGLKGYEGEWTDDDLYKFFNITSEEQKIIEKEMKKYS